MQSLAKVQAGESCEIKWMFGNADVMNFLKRYGIKEGRDRKSTRLNSSH